MKKIGIDCRLINQTGVGTYIKNLLYYLQEIEKKEFYFFVYLLKKDFNLINFRKKNFLKKVADFRWHSFNEQIGYYHFLINEELDLMHFTYFSYPILYQKPFVATIHDVTPLKFKTGLASTKNALIYELKHLAFRYILKNQIIKAQKIITPTHSVANELIKIYGERYKRKIIPVYEGVSYELIKNKEKKVNVENLKPFFIYVGNFYPHKNVDKLIKAFKLLKKIKHNLILIGPDDYFKKKLFNKIKQLELEDKIIFYHPQEIGELVYFYKNATALINPSLSEGFGLPLVEAAYFNCPIIASKIPVFKELFGNNYLTFDPYQVDDIADKINHFLRKKMKFNYQNIIKKFSFREMAKKTLGIYKNVLE